jgi:2-polyprenyl-3-methyl-5-hydroxy-6-metoxy-1,4-benzoquinol methylase
MWCDPRPLPVDLASAYQNYYTHGKKDETEQKIKSPVKSSLSKLMRNVYWASRYGYASKEKSKGDWLLIIPLISPVYRSYMDGDVMFRKSISGGGKVLDIGCGDGTRLSQLMELGWEGVGVDFDSQAISRARSKGMNAYCGELLELGLTDNSFDAIILRHVIEHIYNPAEVLKECMRLLKPGGQFVITTPNARSLGQQYFAEYWRGLEVPRHLIVYTCSALVDIAENSGLRVTQCKSFHGASILHESYFMCCGALKTGLIHTLQKNKFLSVFMLTIMESILLHLDRDVGEQIVLTATKE